MTNPAAPDAVREVNTMTVERRSSPVTAALLPCPFCGPGQSMVDPWFDDVSKRWAIGCGRCGASSGRSVHAEGSKESAIKSWNTRALTPAPAADVGRIGLETAAQWHDAQSKRFKQNAIETMSMPSPLEDVACAQDQMSDFHKDCAVKIRALASTDAAPAQQAQGLPPPLMAAIVAAMGPRASLMPDDGKDQARVDYDTVVKWADCQPTGARGELPTREEIAETIWRAESLRALGRDRLVPWSEVSYESQQQYLFVADAILALLAQRGA